MLACLRRLPLDLQEQMPLVGHCSHLPALAHLLEAQRRIPQTTRTQQFRGEIL